MSTHEILCEMAIVLSSSPPSTTTTSVLNLDSDGGESDEGDDASDFGSGAGAPCRGRPKGLGKTDEVVAGHRKIRGLAGGHRKRVNSPLLSSFAGADQATQPKAPHCADQVRSAPTKTSPVLYKAMHWQKQKLVTVKK